MHGGANRWLAQNSCPGVSMRSAGSSVPPSSTSAPVIRFLAAKLCQDLCLELGEETGVFLDHLLSRFAGLLPVAERLHCFFVIRANRSEVFVAGAKPAYLKFALGKTSHNRADLFHCTCPRRISGPGGIIVAAPNLVACDPLSKSPCNFFLKIIQQTFLSCSVHSIVRMPRAREVRTCSYPGEFGLRR